MNAQFLQIADVTPKTVAAALRPLGSLNPPCHYWDGEWGALFRLLAAEVSTDQEVETAAERLLVAAVPVEGDPDPRRGKLIRAGTTCVGFRTPGGVSVEISTNGDIGHHCRYTVQIDFGRASENLVREVLLSVLVHGQGDAESVDVNFFHRCRLPRLSGAAEQVAAVLLASRLRPEFAPAVAALVGVAWEPPPSASQTGCLCEECAAERAEADSR